MYNRFDHNSLNIPRKMKILSVLDAADSIDFGLINGDNDNGMKMVLIFSLSGAA